MSSRQFEKEAHCKSHLSKCSKTIYIYIQIPNPCVGEGRFRMGQQENITTIKNGLLFNNLFLVGSQTLVSRVFFFFLFFTLFIYVFMFFWWDFVCMMEVLLIIICLLTLISLVISESICSFGS